MPGTTNAPRRRQGLPSDGVPGDCDLAVLRGTGGRSRRQGRRAARAEGPGGDGQRRGRGVRLVLRGTGRGAGSGHRHPASRSGRIPRDARTPGQGPPSRWLQRGGAHLRGHGEADRQLEKAGRWWQTSKSAQEPRLYRHDSDCRRPIADQSAVRGDVESVRNWIKQKADGGKLGLERLYLVGSGVGAAVAAGWTVADAAWPPIASGKQGGDVRGTVMIDPSFVTKGFSIGKALTSPPLKTYLPIMLIAGGEDRDTAKIFDQLSGGDPTPGSTTGPTMPSSVGTSRRPRTAMRRSCFSSSVDASPATGSGRRPLHRQAATRSGPF